MKRNDWILAAGVIAAAVLIFCVQLFRGFSVESAVAVVTVAGENYGSYSLDQNQAVEINETNRLVIEDGSVRMEWADCPDQLCVQHRGISRDGESIICLPNQIVISVESAGETTEGTGLDGVVGRGDL